MGEIQYRSLSTQTYDILKRLVIERELKPNAKIDINELSQRLGVSRMPVVEAIARLEGEGLVIRRNRVGTYISPLTSTMFVELFAARQMVEDWMVPLVLANFGDADAEQLQGILAQASQLLVGVDEETFDYRSYSEYDQQFHLGLVEKSQNTQVINFYTSLNSHVQIARVYSHRALARTHEGEAEHAEILAAYLARDEARIRAIQRLHLERSRAQVLSLVEQHGVL